MKTIIKHVFGLILLGLLTGPIAAVAQAELTWDWPQYTMKGEPENNRSVQNFGGIFFDTAQYRFQSVYMPYMFPDAPEGQIVNVYFRIESLDANPLYTHFPPWVFKDFTLKMGYREDSFVAIRHNTDDYVPFLRNLNTVFYASSIALNNMDSSYYYHNQGAWLKLPLNAGTFYFRRNQNFAIELAGKLDSVGHPISFAGLIFPVRPYPPIYILRTIAGPAAYDSTGTGATSALTSIGFDIIPTGVSELSNILGVGLFPNPAPGGRFNISFDAKQPMKEVSVRISDVTGREVLSRQFSNPGKSFFEEMNLSGSAPGMYFVRITADGEVFSRRVVLE